MLISVIMIFICVVGLIYVFYELNEIACNLEMAFFKFDKDLELLAEVLEAQHAYIDAFNIPMIPVPTEKKW